MLPPYCPMMPHSSRMKGKENRWALGDDLELQIDPQLGQVNRGDWESLVPASNFFLQWDYLRALENTQPLNMRFHYAVLYKKQKPIVAAYFQVIFIDNSQLKEILAPVASSKHVGFIAGWREWVHKGADELTMQVLVSGNNFVSGEYGLAWSDTITQEAAFVHLSHIVRVIIRDDRSQGLISAVLVKDYYPEAIPAAQRLRRSHYHQFLVEPEMIVDIDPDWKAFPDYLAAMSKKYRNRAKSTLKKAEALQVEEFDAAAIALHGERIMELYLAVHKKARFRLSALTIAYFVEMKRVFRKRFRFYSYSLDGRIVGFRTAFLTGDTLEAHFIGVDYAVNRENCLYQAMLYDFVNEGIANRVSRVYLGRTASEIKSTVGARPHDLTCFIRHRNSFSNQIIRPFIDYLKPSEWVPRNPFKEEQEEPVAETAAAAEKHPSRKAAF